MDTKERIQYFDIMRGFAMFLVVFGHVEGFCLQHSSFSIVTTLAVTYHMPLFFFICGFFAFKPYNWFREGKWVSKLGTQALRLLIPAFFFVAIYPFVNCYFAKGESYKAMLATGYFGGLWFLVSLFTMIAIYYLVSALASKINIRFTKAISIGCMLAFIAIGGGECIVNKTHWRW